MPSPVLKQREGLELSGHSQDLAARFELSTRDAAQRLGVSPPTLLKLSRQHPDLLPRLCIPTGQRKLYRFACQHVDDYKRHHMETTP